MARRDEASRDVGRLIQDRRQRRGVTAEMIAQGMRELGLDYWRQQTVSRTEKGDHHLTWYELVALANVMQSLGIKISRGELMKEAGRALDRAAMDANVERSGRANPKSRVPASVGLATERRAAETLSRRLGRDVPVEEVRSTARRIFGRSLAQEREARLVRGSHEGSAAVRRGHVSRQLMEELRDELKEG